jgi:hypothetical protein
VLVGHSLGAGTAALLACMINDGIFNFISCTNSLYNDIDISVNTITNLIEYNIPMHCYAFAPPCVLSLDLVLLLLLLLPLLLLLLLLLLLFDLILLGKESQAVHHLFCRK